MKRVLLIIGGIIVVLIFIAALIIIDPAGRIREQESSSQSESVATEAQSTNKQEVKEDKSKKYQKVFTFSGNVGKMSEPFTIKGSYFRIKYDCPGEGCFATLYEAGKGLGDMPKGSIVISEKAVKDETIFYGAGEYYIDASLMINSYSMTVEDYK